MSTENESTLVKSDSPSMLEKAGNVVGVVAKFADDHGEDINKAIEFGGKEVDNLGQGAGELARGTGQGIAAVGSGIGNAVGAVGEAVKIAAGIPTMIAKYRSEQKQLETLATVRLAELAGKYKAWSEAFDTESADRDRSLTDVEKVLDTAIANGDREAMLKSLDALISTLEKTDLTRHSTILTEDWKGTTLSGTAQTPQPNLLDDNSEDFDPGF